MSLGQFVWAVAPSLIVGIVLAVWGRAQKKRERAAAEREAERLQAEQVRISLLMASAKLSYATAVAMKRGHANGEVEDGIKQYQEAITQFKQFERKLVARKVLED